MCYVQLSCPKEFPQSFQDWSRPYRGCYPGLICSDSVPVFVNLGPLFRGDRSAEFGRDIGTVFRLDSLEKLDDVPVLWRPDIGLEMRTVVRMFVVLAFEVETLDRFPL